MSIGDMVVRIVGDNTQFDSSIDKSEAKFKAFGISATTIGRGLSLAITTPLLALGVAAVKSSANMEMLEASFTTMLGSAEKAKIMMEDIKDMASVTPFEAGGLAQATKTLLQFGITGQNVIPTLKMIGDISGGSQVKMDSLALVFGQINSAGKLMGQDLLQLINAGFNPLKEISDRTGESMASLKDKMSKGAITSDMVAESFKKVTSEGGLFYKGAEIASKTLSGLMSTLKDDVGAAGRSFVNDLMPAIKETVKGLSKAAQFVSNLDADTKKLILTFAAVAAATGPIILGLGFIIKSVGILNTVFTVLAAHPVIAAMIAIGAATAIIATSMKVAAIETKTLKNALSGIADIQTISAEITKVNKQIAEDEAKIKRWEADIGDSGSAGKRLQAQIDANKVLRRQLNDNLIGKQLEITLTEKQNEAELILAKSKEEAAKKAAAELLTSKDAAAAELRLAEDGVYENLDRIAEIRKAAREKEAADTIKDLQDQQEAEFKLAEDGNFENLDRLADIKNKAREEDADAERKNALKKKDINISMANGIIAATSSMVSSMGDIMLGSVEDLGKNFATLAANVASYFGPGGTVISGVISVGIQIYDIFTGMKKQSAAAAKQLIADIAAYKKAAIAAKKEVLELSISNEQAALDNAITAIDEKEAAELAAKNLADKLESETIKSNITNLQEELLTETDLEQRAAIQAQIIEEQKELEKTQIQEKYQAERDALTKASLEKQALWEYQLAKVKKDIALAEAKIQLAEAEKTYASTIATKPVKPSMASVQTPGKYDLPGGEGTYTVTQADYEAALAAYNTALAEYPAKLAAYYAAMAESLQPYVDLVALIEDTPLPLLSTDTTDTDTTTDSETSAATSAINASTISRAVKSSLASSSTATDSAVASSDMQQLIIQMDTETILDKIFPATKNRTVLISAGAVI